MHVVVAVATLLVLSILVAGVLVGTAASRKARSAARTSICLSNLRQMSVGGMSYAMDFRDGLAQFSWRAGKPGERPPAPMGVLTETFAGMDEPDVKDDLEAASWQALEIIRRRGGDTDSPSSVAGGWTPQFEFAHLVLADYLASNVPDRAWVCPNDVTRHDWINGLGAGPGGKGDALWRYSSSYAMTASSYVPDRFTADGGSLRQGADQRTAAFVRGGGEGRAPEYRLGGRRISEVMFPSAKVMTHESVDRHHGAEAVYFTDPESECLMAMTDGAVREVKNAEANPGGYWLADGGVERPAAVRYAANGALGDPGWRAGVSPSQAGRYRWTLTGLRGVDVGGPERER